MDSISSTTKATPITTKPTYQDGDSTTDTTSCKSCSETWRIFYLSLSQLTNRAVTVPNSPLASRSWKRFERRLIWRISRLLIKIELVRRKEDQFRTTHNHNHLLLQLVPVLRQAILALDRMHTLNPIFHGLHPVPELYPNLSELLRTTNTLAIKRPLSFESLHVRGMHITKSWESRPPLLCL